MRTIYALSLNPSPTSGRETFEHCVSGQDTRPVNPLRGFRESCLVNPLSGSRGDTLVPPLSRNRERGKGRGLLGIIATALTFMPVPAHAHLVNSGLGPFYDGALHLLLSPGDLLGLVAAALLAGLCGARAGRLTVLVLPTAWFIAGIIGLNLPVTLELPWLSALSFVVLGVLVAADLKLAPMVVAALAGLYGALHGLLNGSALAAIGAGPLSFFGIVMTVLVFALLLSAAVVSLYAAWMRIVVRVAGSWVVAVGMLMLGWLAKGAK